METFTLSLHADYRCRSSGACCSSGWAVAVEPQTRQGIEQGLREGRFQLPASLERLPEAFVSAEAGADPVLATDRCGRCVFYEEDSGRLCAIHRQLGHEALPSACRHFPRVVLQTPRGIWVALSHYCPTVASLPFRTDRGLEIVRNPEAFPPGPSYEGLDARAAWPPLLRPGVLMCWDSHVRWEAHQIATFARAELSPEQALQLLARQAEAIRSWPPAGPPLVDWMEPILARDPDGDSSPPARPLAAVLAAAQALEAAARRAVPRFLAHSRPGADLARAAASDPPLPRRQGIRQIGRASCRERV